MDPKKAVRAIRKLMAAVPAAYVVSRASFNDLTRAPGVITKNIVSPHAWPAIVQTEVDSEDEEGKKLFFFKSGVVTALREYLVGSFDQVLMSVLALQGGRGPKSIMVMGLEGKGTFLQRVSLVCFIQICWQPV